MKELSPSVVVLITVCEKYKDRIDNLIKNFNFFKDTLDLKNITPLFVYGKDSLSLKIPYHSVQLDVEERYTTLYQKIFKALKYVHSELNYDFIVKIDDDTLVNFNLFDKTLLLTADYTGRMHSNYSINTININLPMFNINQTLNLYPSKIFNKPFQFATGDFYILSKAAVSYILEQEKFLDLFSESDYVCEDQMIGYFLKDSNLKTSDINLINEEIETNILQITSGILSLHPVNTLLFKSLIGLEPSLQLQKLLQSKRSNLWYRKSLINSLETELKEVLLKFANSSKLMGMG